MLSRITIFILLQTIGMTSPAFARQEVSPYYETSIFFMVQGIGGIELPALIVDDIAYLSVSDVFSFLQIRNTLSGSADTVSGTFITEQAIYLIDKTHNCIQYEGKTFVLQENELISTPVGLYLSTELFGRVFGLNCKFNFRNLSVSMDTKHELPVIREMRQQQMHQNINRLKGQVKADTVIGRDYPLFQLGMADWSVVTTQRGKGGNDTRASLSLGGTLAGGETNVALNYNNYGAQQSVMHDSSDYRFRPFERRQQYYRWRFVNNDHKGLRQVIAGKIFAQSTASVYDPVVGVQVTNTPTTNRRTFGFYTLSNFTEPNWTVELYVNNELVDYAKADASGFFTFQVPLVYGTTIVKLRFYGPWGEERFREENISVPFNFLPHGEFEYTASAGVVEDSVNSRLGRVSFNYGATRLITIGGGVEYLSSVTTGETMPFVSASMRLASNLLFSGDYTYGVRAQGMMTWRLPANLLIEANYTRYKKGQKAIIFNYLEERKLAVSRTFVGRKLAVFSRLTLNQFILPGAKYTAAEWLMSGAILGVGANFTTYAVLAGQSDPYLYSNLALSFRLPKQLMITPQVQYEYMQKKIIGTRCELGKYFFRNGYLNMSYERNYRSNFSNVSIGIRYDFSFSQVGFSASRSNATSTFVQSARGSLILGDFMDLTSRTSVGTGGIVIQPFLDLNGNGHRDKGEPKVAGLQIMVNGGRIIHNKRDTTIRILELEPYSNYLIDMRRSSFDNIAWRLKHPTVSVIIDPNRVKPVEVPVVVVGEVSGEVYLNGKGLGRIVVCIYSEDGSLAARLLSESDGFFSFNGLAPGNYIARIEHAQLLTLGMTASPAFIPFYITGNEEGDVVDTLEFRLQTK
ncbi:hypothetical protein QFZ51_000226 [Chitinophaga sp. W3I9]